MPTPILRTFIPKRRCSAGGSLADIGSKRSLTWLNTWLRKPETLNQSHRMPVFELSSQERRQLALALSSLRADDAKNTAAAKKKADTASAPAVDDVGAIVKQGNQLILDFGCRSCHVTTAKETAPPKQRAELTAAKGRAPDWKKSCIRDRSSSNGKPHQPGVRRSQPRRSAGVRRVDPARRFRINNRTTRTAFAGVSKLHGLPSSRPPPGSRRIGWEKSQENDAALRGQASCAGAAEPERSRRPLARRRSGKGSRW